MLECKLKGKVTHVTRGENNTYCYLKVLLFQDFFGVYKNRKKQMFDVALFNNNIEIFPTISIGDMIEAKGIGSSRNNPAAKYATTFTLIATEITNLSTGEVSTPVKNLKINDVVYNEEERKRTN